MFRNTPFDSSAVGKMIPAMLFVAMTLPFSGIVSAQNDLNEGQRREVMQNLERGASALRMLGHDDEANRLIEIARELNQPQENRERPRDREQNQERSLADRPARDRGQDDRPQGDRRQADQRPDDGRQNDRDQDIPISIPRQLEVFRMANHAFREGERMDAIEMVERVIHGLEMQNAGRRGDEAQQAIREMPGRGDQIELLIQASRFWNEHGHETQAEALAAMARQFQQQNNRDRNADRPQPRDQPGPDRDGRNRQQDNPPPQNRQIEEIHQNLQRLSGQIEQLQRQMNEMRDRR